MKRIIAQYSFCKKLILARKWVFQGILRNSLKNQKCPIEMQVCPNFIKFEQKTDEILTFSVFFNIA